ncbi:MAG: hypothetical protein NDI95_06920 [Acidovorax soli]|uniref:hypothetical protein n=1 Tax=Acidovorax soli TaxID=592050 RepID=UPI0026EEDC92|nr:hypothetical protein [Acidovorax soli]MCM2346366.1 hypothetical protein [Acidovorax soli]
MRKKVVAVLVAMVVGAGVGAALGYGPLLRYKSEGVLSMEIGTAEYKRFAELAVDGHTVQQYVGVVPPPGLEPSQVEKLVRDMPRGEWLMPVPKVSKVDAKQLPDILLQIEQEREKLLLSKEGKEGKASVYLGVQLSYSAPDPHQAAGVAGWLGAYFKDVATRETVRDQVSRWAADNRQFSDRALERKLKYQFDIEQAQNRVAALKKVMSSYPDVARRENQQVVDVRKDNEKFMSPVAQLVGAESEMIDIREKLQRLDREMEQQAFAKALITDAQAALGQARSGSESVLKLADVIVRFSKETNTEAQREKLSSLAADMSSISARFLSQAQFIAQPSVPSRPERPRPLMVIALVAVLAGVLAALLAWRDALVQLLREPQGPKA